MRSILYLISSLTLLLLTGCMRNSSQAWEDLKTVGKTMHREVDSLFGKDYESRLLTSNEEFIGPGDEEFIPLKDSDLKSIDRQMDSMYPQSKRIPGQKGVPSLSEYYTPPDSMKNIFKSIQFETDEYIAKDKHDIEALIQLSKYLKEHQNVYLFIEGHCDERASASYNMALGMRRANFVRSFLVKHGVDLNRIYTSSRGKEQPLAQGHTPGDWKVNRRSEFKIYEK